MRTLARARGLALGAVLAAACASLAPAEARADAARCADALVDGTAAFVRVRAKAVARCRDAVVRGKLPQGTDCASEARVLKAVEKAREKLDRRVAAGCGGGDRRCGTGGDDEPLTAVGWNVASCPSLRGASCTHGISHCGDVRLCLECIGSAAVDQALAMAYDGLHATDPKTERGLNRCQAALGTTSSELMASDAKAWADCIGRGASACPDARAQDAMLRALKKQAGKLCRACAGEDRSCGSADDPTVAELGFAASCLDVGACGGAVTELAPAVLCTECVAGFEAACAVQAAAASYPPACAPAAPPVQLDFALRPAFGATSLAAGFAPDPFAADATAGGPVDASYLGGGCTGFASAEPSFSVTWGSSGLPSTLRFYFVGSGNTTLLVNAPNGSWACGDDSYGTPSPTVEYVGPASGRYDVWVGTFAPGAGVGGTLFVTESAANHP